MNRGAAFLAVDLGAESGRVFSCGFDGERIFSREVHRFPNVPARLSDGLYWDILRIFSEIKTGLAKAAGGGEEIWSLGVNSWGVDFGLLDREGMLVSNPRHYRDRRTEGIVERALERVPKEEIYRTTGIQFLRLNTLCQLLAMENSPLLEAADTLLLIPDLINYWLTGEKSCEYTNATTTQLYDPRAGEWARGLMEKLSMPARLFTGIVAPATRLGPLLPQVAEETGMGEVPVVAVASHDTASAVAAIPAENENFAYISSGTWSLVGVETPEPVMTGEAMEANFTNEGGFGGRTRFLKNVTGLWLLQECRGEWARGGRDYSYEELARLAETAPGAGPLIDPDHPAFLDPGDMASRIRSFCEAVGQEIPKGPGEVSRCIFESLALKYALVLEQAQRITGKIIEVVHVIGGGSQNELLCRLTADATGLPVLSGPVEATVLGNAMVQACAGGYVESLEEIRRVIRRSVRIKTCEPRDDGQWAELRERFREVVEASRAPGTI